MRYTEEMILRSESGYCMPFEERTKDVEMSLGYGEQQHPVSGEAFFHHGVDFNVRHYPLSAVASGSVCAIGSDDTHGIYMTLRHGKYEVTYGHLSNVFANFGHPVRAGHAVAVSGDMLHVAVKFDGQELNPLEFLTMLYGNIKAMEQNGRLGAVELADLDMGLPTRYEKDKREIEELMLRFLPTYMQDLRDGEYDVPEHTEQSLRNIFSVCASKNYFFETMPSMANPLGIGQRIMPLACKVQNMLIADFLNYLALRHGVFLSSLDERLKKKPRPTP